MSLRVAGTHGQVSHVAGPSIQLRTTLLFRGRGDGHGGATQRTSSRPEGGCCPVLIEGSGETQACDAVRWGRIRTTLLSVAATYEHIADSVGEM